LKVNNLCFNDNAADGKIDGAESAVTGRMEQEYGKLYKVYSIWICFDV
jgi:hypothetical protein